MDLHEVHPGVHDPGALPVVAAQGGQLVGLVAGPEVQVVAD